MHVRIFIICNYNTYVHAQVNMWLPSSAGNADSRSSSFAIPAQTLGGNFGMPKTNYKTSR